MPALLPDGDNVRQWVAIAVVPAVTLFVKYLVDRRTQHQAARGEWRGDVETMRDSWKETWEALSQRVERAEEGEAECLKRSLELDKRQSEQEQQVAALKATVGELNHIIHKNRETEQVLMMERDMLDERVRRLETSVSETPNEDGDPK